MLLLPRELQPLCDEFLDGLKTALGGKLHGVYLHGAVLFPDAGPTKDVDFHVVVGEPLTPGECRELDRLDQDLNRRFFPETGDGLDCYYILLADARLSAPPVHQRNLEISDGSWALHRAHMLAGRCVVLMGPEPEQLFLAPSWPELAAALCHELEWIENGLDSYPAYCVLNLCRVMHSFATKEVVISKRGAATGIGTAYPVWGPSIAAAKRWYEDRATDSDDRLLSSQMGRFRRFALGRIYESPHWIPDECR
jgi:hypothetical protein